MTFTHVDVQNIKIMSSCSQPAIITFIDETGTKKPIMFKNDDVRKDYIVLNIINIIHDILRREEDDLDIEMVRYEVIPTSQNTGYIEIVENAATIFNIIENSGLTIQNFILNNNKELMIRSFREKFIKSTALYCVVSYLLGIGDRHLDNIMISKNGLLFHIDFGFILGQDPKYSNNRLIRVTPEIVNVIGGYGTEDYDYFKKTCVKIYNRLRLHVNLFSNLLSIIPAIDQNINHDIIRRELTERFEIGENCIEAATHMDNKVGSKNNFEYMIIDFLYKSKKSPIFKGISYVTGSLLSLLSNKSEN
jgi:phosphatidylinositol kinase/protein kinase (PI-3  family)